MPETGAIPSACTGNKTSRLGDAIFLVSGSTAHLERMKFTPSESKYIGKPSDVLAGVSKTIGSEPSGFVEIER